MSPVNTDTSFIENRAPNVAVQFRDRVHTSPSRTAYSYPAADGQPWTTMTWKETGDRVEKLAAGLLALGLETEQRVGIASGTRVEWILADLAVMCAGGATTTVYPSTMPRTSPTSWPTPSAGSSSPRTRSRWPSSGSTGPSCPTSTRWCSSTARLTATG